MHPPAATKQRTAYDLPRDEGTFSNWAENPLSAGSPAPIQIPNRLPSHKAACVQA